MAFLNVLITISWLITGWALIHIGYAETDHALRILEFMLLLLFSLGLSGFKVVVRKFFAKGPTSLNISKPVGFNTDQNSQPEILAKDR